MKIRGQRECTACGTTWSYYETGQIDCPACGSLRSVGLDSRTEHTDSPVEFDLTPVRTDIDTTTTTTLADRTRDHCRTYVRQRGFIVNGELRTLDDTYLAATELMHVAATVARRLRLTDDEEHYFLSLLATADDGDRPATLPDSLRTARGLAVADAVRDYRKDIRTWSEDTPLEPPERATFDTLGEHETRIRMLEGDVSPDTAATLLAATREFADALAGDEAALVRAQERLERLG